MKAKFNKYFILVWFIITIAYNAILFLLFSHFSKESLKSTNFWMLYGCMMFALLLWLVLGCISKTTKFGGLSPINAFIYPYVVVVFIMTTIMFLFVSKIMLVFIIVPMVILTAILAILTVFSSMNEQQIKENPQRIVEIFNVENLKEFFENLSAVSSSELNLILSDLAMECENLVSASDDKDIVNIEKRMYEYAMFIKKNIEKDEQLNIYNNINKFRELLKEREALIAKRDN